MNQLPDLVVHDAYYDFIAQFEELNNVINLKRVRELGFEPNVTSKILTDKGLSNVIIKLRPYFKTVIGSGTQPAFTSFTITQATTMYRINSKVPRYVLWTEQEPLPICATCVDRVSVYGIATAVRRITQWANSMTISNLKSIAVFDLDDTLINSAKEKLKGADELLQAARERYDLVVMWSHGSQLHVDEQRLQFPYIKFDLVLNNTTCYSKVSPKNLLSLYNYFPNTAFTKATLVDDSVFNYCPEYDKFLIPHAKNVTEFIETL